MSAGDKEKDEIIFEEENENEHDSLSDEDEFAEFSRALDERIDALLRPVDETGEEAYKPADEVDHSLYALRDRTEPVEYEVDLDGLIEKMHMAYLALEWEFSDNNLEKLKSAVADIEQSIKLNEHASRACNIINSLISLFRQGDKYVNIKSMRLLKEAIQTLSKVVKKGEPIKEHAELVNKLGKSFDALIGEFAPAVQAPPIIVEQEREVVPERVKVIEPERPTERATVTGEVVSPAGVESALESLRNVYEGIEKTTDKLKILCAKLAKKPALKPLSDYLYKIGQDHNEYLNRLKELETYLLSLPSLRPEDLAIEKAAPLPEPSGAEEAPLEIPDKKKVTICEGVDIPLEYRKVFLAQIIGLYYFLPARFVVRIAHASRKKMETILARGYATLGDFKPFFGNIKRFVIEPWNNLSAEELKALRFRPIDVGERLGIGNTFQAVGGDALLLSFDFGNFIIFVDAVLSKDALEVERLEMHPEESKIVGYADAGKRRGVPLLSDKLFRSV